MKGNGKNKILTLEGTCDQPAEAITSPKGESHERKIGRRQKIGNDDHNLRRDCIGRMDGDDFRMNEITEYQKSVRFGKALEKFLPWVLLIFFSGLGSGYGWAFYHYVVLN